MYEDEEDDGSRIVQQIAGVVLAILLTLCGVAAMGWGDASVEPRMETVARETPGMILWWREDAGLPMAIGVALIIAPLVLVPGAFGVRYRRFIPTLKPGWRAVLVLWLAAAIGAEAVVYRTLGGREIGVATADGVKWLRNGTTRDQWRWEQATAVSGGCTPAQRSSQAKRRYAVEYLVAFPDDRQARLSFRMEDAAAWARILKPIDDRLTAAGVSRAMERDADCLTHYQAAMDDGDRALLRQVLRPAD
ncbi:MAG: hypothetical protein QM608_11410 [Caulobacter sp.]